ncbi:MAG: MerR family transcriptional regulator [Candidatus Margulisiibacteriota bacterium]|nr:MAG: MerR family transcriptional regulator [Candidatus Margulisiibacteriota bacterium]HAR63710.1 MerR family transcriptional regulator [Candidatus Margulisiibacteriota bacterium]HCT85960.1 MerR family transcriptional regulator [Candidatus Margulisiibacteriota bacterium]HCY37316.1 MerR family transcriptional regulator [Candidatus Margulisiibacteriota bacterium]
MKKTMPVYSIGIAAKILDIHPRTLRIYEEEGLIKPGRQGGKRLFSQNDLTWIQCLRNLIHEENLSIPGIKKLLELIPCWKLKKCPPETRANCTTLEEREKKCWEMAKNACEKSCESCEVYLKDKNQAS